MAIDTSKLKSCTRCDAKMNDLGIVPFRIGGSEGLAMFFFGDIAEQGERKADLHIFRCENCNHVEFFDVNRTLPDNEYQVI